MEKQRKIKMLSIIALVIAVLGVTIAFAALSGTLRINGSGTMDRADWNIYFDNLSSASTKGKGSVVGTPTLEEHGAEISNIKVKLKQPQDSVTYTVDIVNNGDIDAEIDNIVLPNVPNEYKDILDFKVVYTDNNEEPKKGDVLTHTSPNNTRNLTIKISYKDITDESLLPEEEGVIDLTYKINYVQKSSDKEEEEEPSNISSSDTYNLGDKFCLNGDKECFYTISDNGENVTALAEWNLDTNAGIQSSSSASVISFSETAYWDPNEELNYDDGQFVYNSSSNLWTPVQNYQTYLRDTLGKTSVSATISGPDTLIPFISRYGYDFSSWPSWFLQTIYWTGVANTRSTLYIIYQSGLGALEYDVSTGWNVGLRPVITISKSEI